jgi:hypothetical protein
MLMSLHQGIAFVDILSVMWIGGQIEPSSHDS